MSSRVKKIIFIGIFEFRMFSLNSYISMNTRDRKKIKAALNCKLSKLSILVPISYLRIQEKKMKNFGAYLLLNTAKFLQVDPF